MGRIFISYRRSDAAVLAGRIYDAMAARFGRRDVFRDTEDIPVGARFPEFLSQTLYRCQIAFILIGPTWLSATHPDGTRRLDDPNDYVRVEIETALARGLLVCPLLLDGAAMPAAEDLPPSICEVHWRQALPIHSAPADFAQDMDRLAADIKRAVEGRGGTLVERFALLGRTTAIPLVAGAAGVAVGATAAKGGKIGDRLAKGCSTVAAKVTAVVAAVVVATTVVVAVAHPALLPFAPGRSRVVPTAPAAGAPTNTLLPHSAIKSFPIPTAASGPAGIVAGRDGNLWFTERDGNKIAKITPAGVITEFPIPTAGAHPTDIAAGPDGNVWFDEATAGKIGRITPTGTITEFAVPSDGLQLTGVTGGPDGAIWFCESSSTTGMNKIDTMTLAGTITEHILFTVPPNTGVSHIHPGPDHNLWFTGFDSIERVTPSSVITDFVPDNNVIIPLDITTGPDGNLWFTDIRDRAIGRSTPAGAITLFPISDPSRLSASDAITAGSDGNLWFTYSGGIRRITPAGTITEFALPRPSTPVGIAAGSDGDIWFTEADGNKIGVLAP